jgi:hypothetical protein
MARASLTRTTLALALAVAVAVAAVAVLLRYSPSAEAQESGGPSIKVIARGLDNPRGLELGPKGALYVAEAGKGGTGPCGESPEGGQACYGRTGAITRIEDGAQKQVVGRLPSFAGTDGSFATGPHDVSVVNRKGEKVGLYFVIGEGPRQLSGDNRFMRLFRYSGGETTSVADLLAFESRNNPDKDVVESNPYSLEAHEGKLVVADAAANALLRVTRGGNVSTLAVFPEREVTDPFTGEPVRMDAVPDSVAVGPGGAYYVGQLTGYPFPVGGARVYRVAPGGGQPKVFAGNFTNIIDVAFGPDDSLYVLEIVKKGLLQAEGPGGDLTGRLVRLYPDGRRLEVASEGLVAPTSVVASREGTVYVSNHGVFAGQGQVVRIEP